VKLIRLRLKEMQIHVFTLGQTNLAAILDCTRIGCRRENNTLTLAIKTTN